MRRKTSFIPRKVNEKEADQRQQRRWSRRRMRQRWQRRRQRRRKRNCDKLQMNNDPIRDALSFNFDFHKMLNGNFISRSLALSLSLPSTFHSSFFIYFSLAKLHFHCNQFFMCIVRSAAAVLQRVITIVPIVPIFQYILLCCLKRIHIISQVKLKISSDAKSIYRAKEANGA